MNITKSTLGALAFNGRETTYFDDTLKGFGVRVGKTSASYIACTAMLTASKRS